MRIQALYQYKGQGPKCEYIFQNNSSKIFSCIGTHANTGPTCIRAKIYSSRIFSCMYRFCAGGYLAPILPRRPPSPGVHHSASPPRIPPPPLYFQINSTPPFFASDSSFLSPPPKQKKNKLYLKRPPRSSLDLTIPQKKSPTTQLQSQHVWKLWQSPTVTSRPLWDAFAFSIAVSNVLHPTMKRGRQKGRGKRWPNKW